MKCHIMLLLFVATGYVHADEVVTEPRVIETRVEEPRVTEPSTDDKAAEPIVELN